VCPASTYFPAVVIGGGISGLSCAYRLRQSGIRVCVLDSASRPGGMIETVDRDGFRFECGPQSFLSTPALLELVDELGLGTELLHADERAPRYILLRGQLVPAPLAAPSLLTTPLLNFRTKWRILTEICRRTSPPPSDESIAAFVRRKFGDELLERLVAPFVSGIYAGDPDKLSLRAAFPKLHEYETRFGSVLRGAMKTRPPKGTPKSALCTFRAGMATLPLLLADKLADSYCSSSTVVGLRRTETGESPSFAINIVQGTQISTLSTGAIIIATPTKPAAEILRGISDQFATILGGIEYAPVAIISAGYRREQIQHQGNGFGFLVPRSEGLHVLGTVWNSSLFPVSAPDGMALFTSFAGGATDPQFCARSQKEIAETVCAEVENILGISGPPATLFARRYERALPQYNIGHSETISALNKLAETVPGLFFAGNYLSGPSIGACVEQAEQTAHAAQTYLG
jgi:oxygen-dependent protoporphyrinogen oxidase